MTIEVILTYFNSAVLIFILVLIIYNCFKNSKESLTDTTSSNLINLPSGASTVLLSDGEGNIQSWDLSDLNTSIVNATNSIISTDLQSGGKISNALTPLSNEINNNKDQISYMGGGNLTSVPSGYSNGGTSTTGYYSQLRNELGIGGNANNINNINTQLQAQSTDINNFKTILTTNVNNVKELGNKLDFDIYPNSTP